jgi:hypothetical protein
MQLFGINVFQFFVSFYPIEYNSLTLFPLLFYALILLAFFINKKTDALMCIVSTVMFVFSAMSRPPYTTMFIPLLVYLIIKKDTEKGANTSYRIRKETLYPLIGLVALVVLFMVTVIDSHEAYNAQSPPIAFGTINFNITNESNGAHALDGMVLQLGSKLTNETNGTLLIVSTKPNSIKNIRLTNFNGNASDFIYTYFNVPLQLNNITNFTRLKLFASGDHYMTSIEIPIK